jgi:hypothetical protein
MSEYIYNNSNHNMSEVVFDAGVRMGDELTTNMTATRGRRSPNYSTKEELIICKAFIHASEDCIHGNAMKGTKFEQLMGDAYKLLCETQLREEQTAYELLVRTNRHSLGDPYVNSIPGQNPPSPFFPRHGKDLLRHFKINISPAVSRYCGIRATTPIGTGQNELVYAVAIDALYRERVGKPFLYGLCYDYLRNQEKWKKFQANEETDGPRRTSRPPGKKVASATKNEMATIEKLVTSETKVLASALGKRFSEESDEKKEFYSSLAFAVKEGMEMFATSDIATPDKIKMKKMKAAIKMKKLELEYNELVAKGASSDSVPNMIAMNHSSLTPSFSVRSSNDDDDDDDDDA